VTTSLRHAIVRRPAPTLGRGLTTARLGPPDPALAAEQFEGYVAALTACGLTVEILEALPDFPDAHFVEDTAVLLPDVTVLTRPGAPQRRGEVEFMETVLARRGHLHRIADPGTLDGGDVLVAGDLVLVGLSARTNAEGARQLAAILAEHGLACRMVPVGEGLHLKSSVNTVGEGVLLVSGAMAGREELADHRLLVVPEYESYACNTLLVNGRLLVPAGYPGTRRLLEALGPEIIELDLTEFRKMDGGLTCLSLRY